jgi:hypothetical protein
VTDQPADLGELNVTLSAGWQAALRELEHQATHLEIDGKPDAADALFTAVEITRAGGLQCEHRRTLTDCREGSHGD